MNEREGTQLPREGPASDYLSEVIKSVLSSPEEKTAQQEGTVPTLGGGDILSSLLKNPELLSALPSLLSTVKPILEMLGEKKSVGDASITASASPSRDPEASPTQSHSKPKGQDNRAALLCAMKPYLREERRQAIDYIVKLSQLGDILKTL